MWYWIALSSVIVAGFVCGIVEFIYEKKHGIKKDKEKSRRRFWIAFLIFGGLLGIFNNDKKE